MTALVRNVERREFSRFVLEARASLTVGAQTVSCRLGNISLAGALLVVPTEKVSVCEGQPCSVVVHLGVGPAVIQMRGAIAYMAEDRVGIACSDTDLDSFAHLRRLVELNLAEDALLERELLALVHQRGG